HHVLFAGHFINTWCSMSRRRQFVLPEDFSRFRIEGPEHLVTCCSKEEEVTRRQGRPAQVLGASRRQSFFKQFGIKSQGHLPQNFALVKINGIQGSPG